MEKMVSSSNMQHHLHQQLQNQHDSNEVGGWLPPGFRFHPTDEELIKYYLENKVRDNNFQVQAISEVDLNKCEPWDLPEKAKMGEKEWYFYTLRDRKYPTGMRTNRATEAGYWKATGKDKDIFINGTHCLVGMKKTLVFYRGRAPKGEKTNWIMHEYRLEGESNQLQAFKTYKDSEWVVCRIFQKSAGGKKALFIKGTFYDESDGLSSLPPLLEQSDDATIDVDANLNSENGLSFPVLHERPYSRIKDQLDIWVRNKDAGASCSSSELIKFGYGYSGNQTHRISGPQTGFSPNFLPKFSEDPSLGRSEEFRQQPSSQFWKNVMEQCTRGSSDVKGCKIEPYGASEGTQYPISSTQHGYGGLMMESLAFEDSNVGNLLENEISTDLPSSGMYRNGNSNPSDLESMWAY